MLENYFNRYGHKCKLNVDSPFEKYLKNKSCCRKWFLNYSTISPTFILMRSHPRSHAVLRNEMIEQLENYPLSIHPYSAITFYADVLMLLVFLIWVIIIPYDIFFYLDLSSEWDWQPEYLKRTLSTICLVDIVRRFYTGYVIEQCDCEEIVLNLRRIRVKYLQTFFFFDFLSSVPTFKQMLHRSSNKIDLYYDLLSMLKLGRLWTLIRIGKIALKYRRLNYNWTEIITYITYLIVIVHWLACLSVWLEVFTEMVNTNEMMRYDQPKISKETRLEQYVLCLRRTISLMSAAGYHFDSRIPSEADMIHRIIVSVLGLILSSIIFAKTYEKVTAMRSTSAKYEEILSEISNYLRHKNAPAAVQKEIKTFYAYKYEYSFFKEHKILSSIPNSIHQAISVHCAKLLLDNIPIFRTLPIGFIVKMMSSLAQEIVMAGDVIFRSGESDMFVYLLLNGTVAAFNRSGREFIHLEDGSHFGEGSLFEENNKHITTIVAIESCEILRLQNVDFFEIFDYCPDLVEHMRKVEIERHELVNLHEMRFQQLVSKQLQAIEDEEVTNTVTNINF